MLAAVAARLPKSTDNVWVDLGGGTGVSNFNTFFSIILVKLHVSSTFHAGERAHDG